MGHLVVRFYMCRVLPKFRPLWLAPLFDLEKKEKLGSAKRHNTVDIHNEAIEIQSDGKKLWRA